MVVVTCSVVVVVVVVVSGDDVMACLLTKSMTILRKLATIEAINFRPCSRSSRSSSSSYSNNVVVS